MEFDDLQRAWQAQNPAAQMKIDAGMLLKLVRRNQQEFWATIFWRDVREVGVAFLLALYFSHRGWGYHDWTDELIAVACLGIGIFMVVDRIIQRAARPVFNDSLKGCLESSLAQVNHQIWLLRNVFWWYLSPLVVTWVISESYRNWHSRHFDFHALLGRVIAASIVALIFWGVYWLNQAAVRKSLEPRREELEALLASLA